MSLNDIKLGQSGSEVLLNPLGRKFKQSIEEIARQQRTADGTLHKDIVARKKKFSIEYTDVNNTDLLYIYSMYNLNEALSLKITNPDSTESTYTVLMSPYSQERIKAYACNYWGGVTIELSEV